MIASVLKPVDDVRAYWKLSQSIAKTNKYEVNIIGNASKKEISHKNIKVHSYHIYRDQWLKRLIIREKILFKVLKIKPALLIVTTHELLNVSFICKILTGCKVIYDVQENYHLNIKAIRPSITKSLIAAIVRLKEWLSKLYVNEYWLAENCYVDQLPFTTNRSLVIENKAYKVSLENDPFESKIKLLFSGTISSYAGIENAIEIFKQIVKDHEECELKIIGQVHDDSLLEYLKQESKNHPCIKLNISKSPIPHEEILNAISESNLGIIAYSPNVINKEKIPTKLYEYARHKLPYLVMENTSWSKKGKELGGAISIDFKKIDTNNLVDILGKWDELFPTKFPTSETWEFESNKITSSLDKLIR